MAETDSAEECIANNLTLLNNGDYAAVGTTITEGGNLALGQQHVAIRFPAVDLPQGVTIRNAFILFDVDDTPPGSMDELNITITGENQRSDEFSTCCSGHVPTGSLHAITGRPKTKMSVNWGVDAAPRAREGLRTANISAVIQEMVGSQHWRTEYLNPLTIFLDHRTGPGIRKLEKFSVVDGSSQPPWPPEELLHSSVHTDNIPRTVKTPVLVVAFDTSTTTSVVESYMTTNQQKQELASVVESLQKSGEGGHPRILCGK